MRFINILFLCFLSFCVIGLAVVTIAAPLLFTFSRDELALHPREASLYVKKADNALDAHRLDEASYYLQFLESYDNHLVYKDNAKRDASEVRARYDGQMNELRHLREEARTWQAVNVRYENYRDGLYEEARYVWSLGDTPRAISLLKQSIALDPQFILAKNVLRQIDN